jgi:ubiquinone/menaquinone biosynthesis C-methylase UbiE
MTISLREAKEKAAACADSPAYREFVETVREKVPWRFEKLPLEMLERNCLRIVDHHLDHLIPRTQIFMAPNIRRVLDFGCGSGGSLIALAMVNPEVRCYGTDIDEVEVSLARQRAKIYNVADRCEFHCVGENQRLPFADNSFDFSVCSSVLEYALGAARRFCVQEMVRLVAPQGLLFFSVPNGLYPFEIHTMKWGWNYFPEWLQARTVDSSFWEVRRLARPTVLKLYRTSIVQLFRPWSNFCVMKQGG